MLGEEVETKAGRGPALKVGGARVVTRHRTTSEEVKEPKEDAEEEEENEEDQAKTKEGKPQLVLWGQPRDSSKDYPSQAVQDRQQKPQPTHPQPTQPRPNIIQQPRK